MKKKNKQIKQLVDLLENASGFAGEILCESGSLNTENVYSLGCAETFHLSIYEQQCRALNLAWALSKKRKINKDTRIAIIGGGIAGATAAIALALKKTQVVLFESENDLLPKFKNASHRWIHPYYFSRELVHDDWTGLPILNWKADFASNMRKFFLSKFHAYQESLPNLEVETKAKVIGIELNHQNLISPQPELLWIKKNDKKTIYRDSFDIYIIAVGHGLDGRSQSIENSKIEIKTNPFWNKQKNYTHEKKTTSVLISGCGDGGIVELLNLTIKNFDHSKIRAYFPYIPNLPLKLFNQQHEEFYKTDTIIKELKKHELKQLKVIYGNNTGENLKKYKEESAKKTNSALANHYREFAKTAEKLNPEYIKEFKKRLNKKVRVTLNGRDSSPYNPVTSLWNQMILAVLERIGAFSYIQGEAQKFKARNNGKVQVQFNSNDGRDKALKTFDHIIQRFGQRSDFSDVFDGIIFNKIPDLVKQNTYWGSLGEKEFHKGMDKERAALIRKVEWIEPNHLWLDRKKTKKRNKIFRLIDYQKQFKTAKDANLLAQEFETFLNQCNPYDIIRLDFTGVSTNPEFINFFNKKLMAFWSFSMPRWIIPDPDTYPKSQQSQISFLCSPHYIIVGEDYLKYAKKYFKVK